MVRTFEPNAEALWAQVRRAIEDFLLSTWRTGALLGTQPEEAFFVRCDRTFRRTASTSSARAGLYE